MAGYFKFSKIMLNIGDIDKQQFNKPLLYFALFCIALLRFASFHFTSLTSVAVTFVLCFGVEFVYCLNLMCVFIFLFKFG